MKTANLLWVWQESGLFPRLTRNKILLISLDYQTNKQPNYCTRRERGEKTTESFVESSRPLIRGASSFCIPAARATALRVIETHNSDTVTRSALFSLAELAYSRHQHTSHAVQSGIRRPLAQNPSGSTNPNSQLESASHFMSSHDTWFETFVKTAKMGVGSSRFNSLSTS